jgi:hypothetical protein
MSSDGNLDWTYTVAERKIQEAMEAGEFDNLPGKGQPLDLEVNPWEPAHLRAANRILKNARALPEWLQLEKDIERERQALVTTRERTLRALGVVRNPASRARIADRFRGEHRERLRALGTLVLKYNEIAPNAAKRAFGVPNVVKEMDALETDLARAVGSSAGAP